MATLFDEAFLRKLEYLTIVSRKVFAGRARAERRTKKIGSGLEFADHRDYAPGDDPRTLDWNVVGRMDRLLVRLFEEEEDLYIHLLVDASRSMTVGCSRTATLAPFDYARQVTAALAYIGLANLDRVSIVPFAETARDATLPTRGKNQIHKVFRFLDAIAPDGVTSLTAAFDAFVARTKHTGLAVVVSDFFDRGGYETGLKRLQAGGFEVFCVHTHLPNGRPAASTPRRGRRTGAGDDALGGAFPRTEEPPGWPCASTGERLLVDAETGRSRRAIVTPATLRRYDEAFDAFQRDLARFCLSRGIGFVRAPVDVPFERAILDVFRQGGVVT